MMDLNSCVHYERWMFVYLQVSREGDGQEQHQHRERGSVGHGHLKVAGRSQIVCFIDSILLLLI